MVASKGNAHLHPPALFLLMLDIGCSVREETSKRGIYPVSSDDVDLYFKGTADADDCGRGRGRTDGGIEIGDNI